MSAVYLVIPFLAENEYRILFPALAPVPVRTAMEPLRIRIRGFTVLALYDTLR